MTVLDYIKAEREELVVKIAKLEAFINDPQQFNLVDRVDRDAILDQLDSMDRYRQALDLRISRMKP